MSGKRFFEYVKKLPPVKALQYREGPQEKSCGGAAKSLNTALDTVTRVFSVITLSHFP